MKGKTRKPRVEHPEKKLLPSFVYSAGGVFQNAFKILGLAIFIAALTVSFLAIGVYANYAHQFKSASPREGGTQATFYDRNGEIIYTGFGTADPDYIEFKDIPDIVKKTTLAAEDSGFYDHGAVYLRGILRAVYTNYQGSENLRTLLDEQEYSQGGSTITQQLVKNRYLSQDRSFERKIKELVYAIELEKNVSKDEILEKYLNYIYYGEQALGIKNAAKIYFGKDVKDLSLAEASMLAGLPQAPSKFSPITGNYDQAKERQKYVLEQMYLESYITKEEAESAYNEPLNLEGKRETIIKYPYFVQYIKQELISLYGEDFVEEGGIKVYTTLDPKVQETAEKSAREHVERLRSQKVTNAAVVVLDNQTEEILAMVGGVDWEKSKVNVATAKRQPGSSFKPFVYATGFQEGYGTGSKLLDTRMNFGGTPPYIPANYDGKYRGNVTVRTALSNSLNIPAVEMTRLVGVDSVIETANKLGIESVEKNASRYMQLL